MIEVQPSAIVDPGAEIGDGSRIWHFCHVSAGARIGRNVSLGQNCFVADGALVGDGCKVQNNVSLYEGVILEQDVFCGPSMVFTNVINPRAAISRRGQYRQTLVKTGATLGANCTILCGVTIGRHAFVGAGTVVLANVPDHALVVGVPARQVGWMSCYGEQIPLPLEGSGAAQCPHTGATYRLEAGVVRLES